MFGSYDFRLVILSYIVACFASYTALSLVERVALSSGRAYLTWLIGGACSFGIGIWSMHFTGMLAYQMDMPIHYHFGLVLLSLVIACIASAIALRLMGSRQARLRHFLIGGPIIGFGIVSMHYIGMEAMIMDATISYNPLIVGLSVLIAIGASLGALGLAFQLRRGNLAPNHKRWFKFGSALVMGLAIAGMHYTGMWAASFAPSALHDPSHSQGEGLHSLSIGILVVAGSLLVLFFTLISILFDQRIMAQSQQLDESALRYQSLFHYHSDAVLTFNPQGELIDANQAAWRIFDFSQNELNNDHFFQSFDGDQRKRLKLALENVSHGETSDYDVVIQARGQVAQLNIRHIPIHVHSRIVGSYMIATDLTERLGALATLKEREKDLQQLVDHQQVLINTIQELSAPVLQVDERVLLIPLVGHLNPSRIQQLISVMLENVQQRKARLVIIDVTGIQFIDSDVANSFLQGFKAVQLLGAEVVIVGISPQVAETLTHLGIDPNGITIRSNLQAGIHYSLKQQFSY